MKISALGDIQLSNSFSDVQSELKSDIKFGDLINTLIQFPHSNDHETENEIVENPIAQLLTAFQNESDLNVSDRYIEDMNLQNVNEWLTPSVGDENLQAHMELTPNVPLEKWSNVVIEILDTLNVKMANEDKLSLEYDEIIAATIQAFQALMNLNRDSLQQLPTQPISEMIQFNALFRQMPLQVKLKYAEIEQLEELKQVQTEFLARLQLFFQDIQLKQDVKQMSNSTNSMNNSVFNGFTPFISIQPMHKTDLVDKNVVQVNDASHPTANQLQHLSQSEQTQTARASSFIRDFSHILAKANISSNFNTTRLFIRLYPEHLGTLNVELMHKDGLVTARLIASTTMAKDLLNSQLSSLKQAFAQQHIQIEKIEVTFSQLELPKYTEQNPKHHHEQNQKNHQQEKQHKNEDHHSIDFSDALNELLFETEV